MGDPRKIFDSAKLLLEYGERNENSRSKVMGNWMKAFAYWLAGDMKFVKKCSEKAIEVALDPFYGQFPKATLGFAHLSDGRLEEAEKVLQSTINFCKERGVGSLSVPCSLFLAPILIAKGQMQKGADLLEKTRKTMIINHRKVQYAISEYIFGEVYSQIATGQKPSLSIMAKNIGFLAKNVPFATKKAEKHFTKAIELFKCFGSKSQLGQTYLSLGSLYKATKRTDQAKQCILEAVDILQECEATGHLKKAKEVLNSFKVADV